MRNFFNFDHKLTPEQDQRYQNVLVSAEKFLSAIEDSVEICPERSVALRKLREILPHIRSGIKQYPRGSSDGLD